MSAATLVGRRRILRSSDPAVVYVVRGSIRSTGISAIFRLHSQVFDLVFFASQDRLLAPQLPCSYVIVNVHAFRT